MKLFCCFSRSHEVLYRNCLAPSLPADVAPCPRFLADKQGGDFLSAEYLECLPLKVQVMLGGLRENPGQILIWSDVDVVFVDTSGAELARLLEESGRDILFQRERPDDTEVNTGFFICRSVPSVQAFFEGVREKFRTGEETRDQKAINHALQAGADLSWGYLPMRYYARTHGWPPPARIALYHANGTVEKNGVEQKIRQFEELKLLRKHRWPALAWLVLQRAPRKMARLVRKRLRAPDRVLSTVSPPAGKAPMKVYCCHTPAHEVLLKDHFLPSLTCGFDPQIFPVDLSGPGDFSSIEYLECLYHKANLIIRTLAEHPNELLIWSDVDIAFFEVSPQEITKILDESGKDLLFQRETLRGDYVNPGFFVCRATPKVLDFYQRVYQKMNATGMKNDQPVINEMLKVETSLPWEFLPSSFYARTHGWPPPARIAIYHANGTVEKNGVEQKIRQFEELKLLRKHRWPALVWLGLQRVPKKLVRLVRSRLAERKN